MTTGDQGKLLILFISFFFFLPTQHDCVLTVVRYDSSQTFVQFGIIYRHSGNNIRNFSICCFVTLVAICCNEAPQNKAQQCFYL